MKFCVFGVKWKLASFPLVWYIICYVWSSVMEEWFFGGMGSCVLFCALFSGVNRVLEPQMTTAFSMCGWPPCLGLVQTLHWWLWLGFGTFKCDEMVVWFYRYYGGLVLSINMVARLQNLLLLLLLFKITNLMDVATLLGTAYLFFFTSKNMHTFFINIYRST